MAMRTLHKFKVNGFSPGVCRCGRLPEDPIHGQETVYDRFLKSITTSLHINEGLEPANIRLHLTTKENTQIVLWYIAIARDIKFHP